MIPESEVPPLLTLCKHLSMSRKPREEATENFPGEGRLSKDLLFPVAVGLGLTLGFIYPAGERERERFLLFMKASPLEQMAETPSLSK